MPGAMARAASRGGKPASKRPPSRPTGPRASSAAGGAGSKNRLPKPVQHRCSLHGHFAEHGHSPRAAIPSQTPVSPHQNQPLAQHRPSPVVHGLLPTMPGTEPFACPHAPDTGASAQAHFTARSVKLPSLPPQISSGAPAAQASGRSCPGTPQPKGNLRLVLSPPQRPWEVSAGLTPTGFTTISPSPSKVMACVPTHRRHRVPGGYGTSQGMPQQEAEYGQGTHLEKGRLGYSVPEASPQEATTQEPWGHTGKTSPTEPTGRVHRLRPCDVRHGSKGDLTRGHLAGSSTC